MLDYLFYGLRLRSPQPLVGVEPVAVATTTPADLTLTLCPQANPPSAWQALAWMAIRAQSGPGWSLDLAAAPVNSPVVLRLTTRLADDVTLSFFSPGATEISLYWQQQPADNAQFQLDLSGWIMGSLLGYAMCLRGLPTLHGAAVAAHGRALGLLGPSGAGKSTLAAAFVAAGHTVLADDHLVVGPGPSALAGPPRLRLWPTSMAVLEAVPNMAPHLRSTEGKLFVAPTASPAAPQPLAAIYLLMPHDPQRTTLLSEELGPAAALSALMSQRFCLAPLTADYPAQSMAALARLVQQVPVRRLYRPYGLADLPATVAALVEAAGQSELHDQPVPLLRTTPASRPPRVSVITTVYNGEPFLAAAIESVLAQTYSDFEYLLVDDCSTDGSAAILRHYAAIDRRIQLLQSDRKINHSYALNLALAHARGELIAILDADDLAHPERLARQVAFLEANPAVGVVGAWVEQIDQAGNVIRVIAFPTDPALARWVILFRTPVLHSAALLRHALLRERGGYEVCWRYANDYSLWAELIAQTRISNLPERLVSYRCHPQQTSALRNTAQRGEVWLLIHRMLAERLALRVPLNTIGELYHALRGIPLADAGAVARVVDLLTTIHSRYLAVEQPDAATAAQIAIDCARRMLLIAWSHRHSQRVASREALACALALDGQLWQRPETRATLRHQRARPAGISQEPEHD